MGRRRRSLPSDSLIAIRASQVENAGLCAEMLDRGECEYISLLHCVLGFVLVLKDAARDSEQPLVIPAHQLPERSGITVAGTSKERSVRWIAARHDHFAASRCASMPVRNQLDAFRSKKVPRITGS
jgi:hypothetical protein